MKYHLFLLFLIIKVSAINSQILCQSLRGTVTDAITHQSIPNATLRLRGISPEPVTFSDDAGRFNFDSIAVGRYELMISMSSYETLVITDLLLESKKATILEVTLDEKPFSLESVDVVASPISNAAARCPSVEVLTVEQLNRLPATYFDPGRMAQAFGGVISTNDGTNNISVRGNSPEMMQWRLEGVEIINPNHLSNAGNANDRPMQNGGGVNILSAQMLGSTAFLTGAFPADYGNILAGAFDMRLRPGNNQQHEFTAQLGVIGLDLAAEGPIGKKGGFSYATNYRYSTLGLLNLMGVKLGDEAVSFQDFALNINKNWDKGAKLSLFMVLGNSKNDFEAKRDTSLWEYSKDSKEVFYKGNNLIAGIHYSMPIKKKLFYNFSAAISTNNNSSESYQLDVDFNSNLLSNYQLNQRLIAVNNFLNYKLNQSCDFVLGLDINRYGFENKISPEIIDNVLTISPYANWNQYINKYFNINTGLRLSSYSQATNNRDFNLEPRVALNFIPYSKGIITLAFDRNSRLLPIAFYDIYQRDPAYAKSRRLSLVYAHQFNQSLKGKLQLYHQNIYETTIAKENINKEILVLNQFFTPYTSNNQESTPYVNNGIEASIQHSLKNNFFWLANATIYRSKIKLNDTYYSARFDGAFAINATVGKEWIRTKATKTKVWGASLYAVLTGGQRDAPIVDWFDAPLANLTEGFSVVQRHYFRSDVRFYLKRSKHKISSTLALDIQNVSNQQNPSYSYYDFFAGKVVQKYHLGLVPILSYRVSF